MRVNIGKPPGPRSKKERIHKVKIDFWDTWNMDCTLSELIEPMLIQLKEQKQGYPSEMFQLIGVPEGVWEYTDEQHELASAKWNELLDAMIWSFHEMNDGDYTSRLVEKYGESEWLNHIKEHEARMQEGFELFGKWFRSLWD